MKVLVVYYSKSGTARDCAELLEKQLPTVKTTLCRPNKNGEIPVSVSDFDAIVIGSSVRMGRMAKPFGKFLDMNKEKIVRIPHAVFVVCAEAELFEEYAKDNIPKSILDSACDVAYFGGRLAVENHKGLERFFVKMMRNRFNSAYDDNDYESSKSLPTISEPTIAQLADKILKELTKTDTK